MAGRTGRTGRIRSPSKTAPRRTAKSTTARSGRYTVRRASRIVVRAHRKAFKELRKH